MMNADRIERPGVSGLTVWYWKQMAIWSELFKRDEMATEYWLRILDARPRDAAVLAKVAFIRAESGGRPEAITLLQESLRIEPDSSNNWFNLGYLQQEEQRHEEALQSFERAIRLNPKQDRAWYGKGLSLIRLDRLEESIKPMREAIKLQPMSPYAYYQLAHVQLKLGQPEAVAKTIKRLSQFEPQVARQLERETGISAGVSDDF
jgi:tetratricopeptide (TPR) repeat protein